MKNPDYIIDERRQKIVTLLKQQRNLSVNQLSQLLAVSKMTIRRDLTNLSDMGVVERIHGGAKLLNQEPITSGINEQLDYIKTKLAKQAASFVKQDDILFINTSSTALLSLNYLKDKRFTVITNNAKVVNCDANLQATVILSGGEVRFPKEALVGDIAIDSFSKMTSDVTIMGCFGLTLKEGITTPVLHESKINNLMIERTKGPVILVADYRRIGVATNFTSGRAQDITHLITDPFANPQTLDELDKSGINIIQVPI